jgi:hypothetical protein
MEKPYDDIRTLIERGFLTHNITVRGVPITIRSLFPSEAKEVVLQSHGGSVQTYKDYIVARSLYMVRGFVLSQKHVTFDLFSMVSEMPLLVRHRLFSEQQGLMHRYAKCFLLVEAFSYEQESRTLWYTQGRSLNDNPFGRFNGIQGIWRLYNLYEDMREDYEASWNNTKFLGSAFSPKGLKKIYEKDKQQKRSDKANREKVIREGIAKYAGNYVEESEETQRTPIMVSAKTEKELMEEYHRWVRGEKDAHDLLVEEYKQKIKGKMSDEKKSYEQKIQDLEHLPETRGVFSATEVATKEQLAAAGFKKKVGTIQGESQRNRLYNRYLEADEVHGDFVVGEDGKVQIRR